jgi:hypothetical protein
VTVHQHHSATVLEPGTGSDGRTEGFLELSRCLTGFGRVQLIGTGLTATYLRTLDAILPGGVLDELLDAFRRLPAGTDRDGTDRDGTDRDTAVEATILADPRLGPVARNIILLWYRGTWSALPAEWRAAYGASPLDTDHVVSAESYQGGLQWVAAGAHPAGARQQGYGAWAVAPEGSRG